MTLEKLTNLDLKISNWIYNHRKPWLTKLLIIITNTMERWLLIPISITFLWIINLPSWYLVLFWFWIMVFCTLLFNSSLKKIFKRPRPNSSQLVKEKYYSFPSGHVMSAIQITCQSLFLLSQSLTPLPLYMFIYAGLFIVIIAFSRIYLGVHYLSDTIGSIFFGTISVAIAIWLFQFVV
jgi:membrane-associated phospholipid phosphatase